VTLERSRSSHMNSVAFRPYSSIQNDSKTALVLRMLCNRAITYFEPIKFKDLKIETGLDGMDLSLRMRRLENTGLVWRPERGYYVITERGICVVHLLDHLNVWKNVSPKTIRVRH